MVLQPFGRALFGRSFCCVLVVLVADGAVRAQELPPPAYIAQIEGVATLSRDGDVTPAVLNMPLIPGDRIRTERGRVEIRFPDGTGIEIGDYSEIEMLTATRVRLLAGTLDRLEPLVASATAASGSYLPQSLQMYGSTFDQYGSWRYAPDYGHVWYPMVAPDWRPYHYGYWEPIRSYGWTWIGADVWSWPTHHYGRWGHARGAWFWIPDRTFAPAWVSWGATTGYVSWCPLGFDNRPVFALSVGFGNAWDGWTVLPRGHFGARGYRVDRFAVAPRHLPRNAAFVTQRVPPVDLPRHVTNGPGVGVGVAVPRGGTAMSRQAPAAGPQSPAESLPPSVDGRRSIPPGRPSGDRWPSANGQRPTNDQRLRTYEQRPRTNDQGLTTNDQGRTTNDPRPDYGIAVPRSATPLPRWTPQPAPAPQPPPTVNAPQPSPRFESPRPAPPAGGPRSMGTPPPSPSYAVPRSAPAGTPRAAPPPSPSQPPPQAAPQRSAPAGGHERSGGTAQPRGGEGPRGGESRSGERRRG